MATVRPVCSAFGISRQAYYAARKAPAQPVARERQERRGPWATVAQLQAGIQTIVAEHPAWGVRKVWASLRRLGLVVSCKRVWAVMKSMNLVLPPAAERSYDLPRGQVAVPDSNRRWASDLTTVWTRQDGVVAVVPVVDCGDRVVLDCEVTKSQEAPCVLAPIARSLTNAFGRPSALPDGLELRTDHGPQYTGRDCEVLCEHWRLDHSLAPVGRPTGNAVAERLILTLKVELLWTRDWDSLHELRQAIADWVILYNHHRPHQALAWRTPTEQRSINLGIQHRAVA
jgi:putative transposase